MKHSQWSMRRLIHVVPDKRGVLSECRPSFGVAVDDFKAQVGEQVLDLSRPVTDAGLVRMDSHPRTARALIWFAAGMEGVAARMRRSR